MITSKLISGRWRHRFRQADPGVSELRTTGSRRAAFRRHFGGRHFLLAICGHALRRPVLRTAGGSSVSRFEAGRRRQAQCRILRSSSAGLRLRRNFRTDGSGEPAADGAGRIRRPQLRRLATGGQDSAEAVKGVRQVYFSEAGTRVACKVYDRYRLRCGNSVPGPAIVEEKDSTSVIHPGCRAAVDEYGNLMIQESH